MPARAPLPGDREGASGSPPQVRDQGAAPAVVIPIERLGRSGTALTTLLVLLAGAGCATSHAPRYGTIAFHDPGTTERTGSALWNRPTAPVTIEYLAKKGPSGAESEVDARPFAERITDLSPEEIRNLEGIEGGAAPGVESRTWGSGYLRPRDGDDPLPSGQRLTGGRLFAKSRPVILDPEAFGELWDELLAAGIEDLPRHRGEGFPRSEPFIVLDDGQTRAVYIRPDPGALPPETARELLASWTGAKALLLSPISN